MDDKLEHHYVTEERTQATKVKWLNADTFEQEVLKNKKVEQCVIEIIKDHCPACFISKFNTNMLSRKMEKHGLLDKIPFYRMKINNSVPWLGEFPHSPMLLYVKKEGDDIVEMKLLESPLPQKKTDTFLQQIQDKSGIKNLTEIIKIDVMAQRTKFFNMLDLEKDFDIDFDATPGYVNVADRKKEEKI